MVEAKHRAEKMAEESGPDENAGDHAGSFTPMRKSRARPG
jgi:hypothetical protein